MATLRAKIRLKISSGILPTHHAPKVYGGKGNGGQCDACDTPITDVELEFDAVNGRVIRFHPDCFCVWNVERNEDSLDR
jgi:hypothetical protein